jgi:hypothetical protein
MKAKLSKLERRWEQTNRLVTKLDKREREASQKAHKAHYALMDIERDFGELYVDSFGEMTSSNKVTEIGRLLSDAKIPFSILRQRETSECHSAYRITVRGKMTNKVVGTFLGLKLTSIADDFINRCLGESKATSTFIVRIYDEGEGDDTE